MPSEVKQRARSGSGQHDKKEKMTVSKGMGTKGQRNKIIVLQGKWQPSLLEASVSRANIKMENVWDIARFVMRVIGVKDPPQEIPKKEQLKCKETERFFL